MKISYTLLKRYLPELTSKQKLIEALTTHSFETEDAPGGAIEVAIPSNRYTDAASHVGVAQEARAVLGLKKTAAPKLVFGKTSGKRGTVSVTVKNPLLCSRYVARECADVRVKQSPKWVQTVLIECGLRPVNNVVDATNIAMLEVGQPLHAFDADKLEGGIVVRPAARGERITTIEGKTYELTPDTLLIADAKGPLAIAGVKGGERAAVSEHTKRIVLEAATFDSRSIYRTSKRLGLVTDASLRFSHPLSPLLAEAGMHRVSELLQDIGAARPGATTDTAPRTPRERHVLFSFPHFERLTGLHLAKAEAVRFLKRLGFTVSGEKISVPPLRDDIETETDLAEEIVRLYGYGAVPSETPVLRVGAHEVDEHFAFATLVRDILTGFGIDEVYTDSFRDAGDVKLANPLANDKAYLRTSLAPSLLACVSENLKFYDSVKLFEIGKVFPKAGERYGLAIAAGDKRAETFFAVKGFVEELLEKLGLTDFAMDELAGGREGVSVTADGKGLGSVVRERRYSYAELDAEQLLAVVDWERGYQPIPKYPAVARDLSLSLPADVKIGSVMENVELSDTDLIEDVDLVDEYIDERGVRQGITLRIVFRSAERTLLSAEVDEAMHRIVGTLTRKFRVGIR